MSNSGSRDEEKRAQGFELAEPVEEIRPGELLLLPKPMVGLRPGLYAVLSVADKTVTICPAVRDNEGKICPQDAAVRVECEDLTRFLRVEDTSMETYH
jgi:hypothetical protein